MLIYELAPIELHEDRNGGRCEAALHRIRHEIDLSHRCHQRDIMVQAAKLWLRAMPRTPNAEGLPLGELRRMVIPKPARYFR